MVRFCRFCFIGCGSRVGTSHVTNSCHRRLTRGVLDDDVPTCRDRGGTHVRGVAGSIDTVCAMDDCLIAMPTGLIGMVIVVKLLLFCTDPSITLATVVLVPLCVIPDFLGGDRLRELMTGRERTKSL